MRFETISITGGASDEADPRSAPESVKPEHMKDAPATVQGTDNVASRILLALEGTASQTCAVTLYALDESVQPAFDSPKPVLADRRFYKLAGPVTVTVGATQELPAWPGRIYFRLTSQPAADAKLLIAFLAGGRPEPITEE